MNNRLALTLCSLAASTALVLACSSDKPAAPGASAGAPGSAGTPATAGAETTAGAGTGDSGGAPGAAGASDSAAGQTSNEEAGASSAATAGSGGTAGKSSNGGAPSAGAGAGAGGTAGSGDTPGDAGAGGAPAVVPQLANSGFELGTLVGWKVIVTPSTAGKSVFAQYPVGDAKAIDGHYEVAFWNGTSAFTGALEQTVTGLTPGKYQLKAYVAFGTGINTAYLYAINCGLSNQHVDLPIIDMVPTFVQFSIPEIEVTGSSCTVGLFADMDLGEWLNADAFSFEPAPAG